MAQTEVELSGISGLACDTCPRWKRSVAGDLATEYVTEKVVGQTSYADCLHIALATINRADFLVSWNFKHIVNIERIRGYNAINIKNGYKQLEIRSPREFEKYEDE